MTNEQTLIEKIFQKIKKDLEYEGVAHNFDLEDYSNLLALLKKEGEKEKIKELISLASSRMYFLGTEEKIALDRIIKRMYHALAYDFFHYFLIYIEWNRPQKEKFYEPRMEQLRVIVDALQDLEDDKLDTLGISMPPGTGKSTLGIFYLSWIGGRDPNKGSLTGSHNNDFLRGVYDEVLKIVDGGPDSDYLWHEVFPDVKLSRTNAKDMRIDLNKTSRFQTFQHTSIGSGNAGKVRAQKLLYCDDLVSGRSVAQSIDQLNGLWKDYTVDLKQRKEGKCKELHIATRWSLHDVIGRLIRENENNPRALFLAFPALDENDESNFDYPCDANFTTAFYHDMRKTMEDIDWRALYMNEPIEKEGIMFPVDDLKYFNGVLPDGEAEIYAACDVAWGGGDSLAMPIGYVYGEEVYILDVIFNKGDKEITRPLVVGTLVRHKPLHTRFEANNGGDEYKDIVEMKLNEMGTRLLLTSKKAPNTMAKATRIQSYAPEIRNFYFLDRQHRTREYQKFMDEVHTFSTVAKNKHDDAPDSLSQLADLIYKRNYQSAWVMKRPM